MKWEIKLQHCPDCDSNANKLAELSDGMAFWLCLKCGKEFQAKEEKWILVDPACKA